MHFIYRYIYPTESGVMSLDVHAEHGNLFCVGFYDGKPFSPEDVFAGSS